MRCNNTARNVIIPDPTLADNEVDVSYNTFRILFKNKIIYYLMKLNDIPLSKAYTIWAKSFMFDNMVLEVMNYIVQKEQPRLLINRNPTLNFYSMLLMKIRMVKHSVDDFTLSVPLSINVMSTLNLFNCGELSDSSEHIEYQYAC